MMLKVNGEFLEFDDDIEIERQVKLFTDDVSGVNGDFSYSFEIPDTTYNRERLGLITPQSSVQRKISGCEIVNTDGQVVYYGILQIDSRSNNVINASFFSNNSDWIDELSDSLRTFDLSKLNRSRVEVSSSWTESGGKIVWPLVNRGCLHGRNDPIVYEDDLQPFIYVKDVVKNVLSAKSIKIAGDLLNDSRYNALITSNNSLSGLEQQINDRKVYVAKVSAQTVNSATFTRCTFTNTSGIYYNSPNNNWDTVQSTYVSDNQYVDLNVNVSLKLSSSSAAQVKVKLFLNSTEIVSKSMALNNTNSVLQFSADVPASSGDIVYVQVARGSSVFLAPYTILTGSSITITPKRFLYVYATQLLPDISASDFLSQIFRLFNCIASYNPLTRTINTRFLRNIRNQRAIDLSEYVSGVVEENYSDLTLDYAQKNFIGYSAPQDDETSEYNFQYDVPYGSGVIEIDNAVLPEIDDLFQLDFVSSFQKDIPWLQCSLPLLNYCELVDTDTKEISSVTNNGDGYARFNFSGSNPFGANQLVRIQDSSNPEYDGVYRIIANTVSYILLLVEYNGDASGTIVGLDIAERDNDDQVLLLNAPSQPVSNFSNLSGINYNGGVDEPTYALGYFHLKNQLLPINNVLKESLSFDEIQGVPSNQTTLKDAYYRDTENILNNPVMPTFEMVLPYSVFNSLDFLSPVKISFNDLSNLYLLNRITGYKDSHTPCEVQVIKLS